MKKTLSLLLIINFLSVCYGQTEGYRIVKGRLISFDSTTSGLNIRNDTVYVSTVGDTAPRIFYLPYTVDTSLRKSTLENKVIKPKFITKNDIIIYSAQFIAGLADGMNQVVTLHPRTFQRIWKNANIHWWLPKYSQDNKKHTLTVISDCFHLSRACEHIMNYFSIGFSMVDLTSYPKKKLPLLVIKKMLASFFVNRIGFRLVYDVAFHAKEIDKNP